MEHATQEEYARAVVHDVVVAAEEAVQRAVRLAEILDQTLEVLGTTGDEIAGVSTRQLAPARTPVSRREQEVLALVAKGRTNKEIAEELYVSPNTVKTHVASLLNKLQARSRVRLAAIASRQEA